MPTSPRGVSRDGARRSLPRVGVLRREVMAPHLWQEPEGAWRGREGEEGQLRAFLYVWPGYVPTFNSKENLRNVIVPKCACACLEGRGEAGRGGSCDAAKLNT